ncbi:hypothetical protein BU25DRAFT_406406 [Macroventuria anomochaeta]|uniref:Uncharacterized protein n=1 Tax=Macroventuria anomochaeta TaxID=301207 RepID=A0ACB6SEY1_9PLEO|nr:uncharacterized protein BU25DRAFT_406406 [Macroventuria anomochaeta]KAF2631874.1 hypothetical protein BU25DRAFT_406406 [Macroventuria anomochaeta]
MLDFDDCPHRYLCLVRINACSVIVLMLICTQETQDMGATRLRKHIVSASLHRVTPSGGFNRAAIFASHASCKSKCTRQSASFAAEKGWFRGPALRSWSVHCGVQCLGTYFSWILEVLTRDVASSKQQRHAVSSIFPQESAHDSARIKATADNVVQVHSATLTGDSKR